MISHGIIMIYDTIQDKHDIDIVGIQDNHSILIMINHYTYSTDLAKNG